MLLMHRASYCNSDAHISRRKFHVVTALNVPLCTGSHPSFSHTTFAAMAVTHFRDSADGKQQ